MIGKLLCILIAFGILFSPVACGKSADKGAVLALVNNERVYQSELTFFERYTRFDQATLDFQNYSSSDLLTKIIEKKIILQEARKNKVRLTNFELETYLKRIGDNYTTEKFKEALKERAIDYNEWQKFMAEQALIEKTLESQLSDFKVEPEEIKKYYYRHLADFNHGEQVRAYQILVKTKTEVNELKVRLDRGEDFEKLAKLQSISPESEKGGDLGYFSREQMPPEISNAVFALPENKVSAPVETVYGFHLFKVTEKKQKGLIALAEAETEITDRIKRERKEVFFKKWIKELAKNADVKIDRELSGVTK